jgi:hypothetical protein
MPPVYNLESFILLGISHVRNPRLCGLLKKSNTRAVASQGNANTGITPVPIGAFDPSGTGTAAFTQIPPGPVSNVSRFDSLLVRREPRL